MRLLIRCIIAIPMLLILAQTARADVNLPKRQGLVNDFARKLSPRTKKDLETTLRDFRANNDIEFAVVIISFAELQGYAIEEYALQMGRSWGIGSGAEKLGLLLVVAIKPPDEKGIYQGLTRLEVSRRLESVITNSIASELIRKMRDDLKAGKFDRAITTGTNSIISALTSNRNLSNSSPPSSYPLTSPAPPRREQGGFFDGLGIIFVFALFAIIVAFVKLRGRLNSRIFGRGNRYSDYDDQGNFYGSIYVRHHTVSPPPDTNNNSPSFFGGSSDFGGGSDFSSDSGSSSDSGGGGDFDGGGSTDSW